MNILNFFRSKDGKEKDEIVLLKTDIIYRFMDKSYARVITRGDNERVLDKFKKDSEKEMKEYEEWKRKHESKDPTIFFETPEEKRKRMV